jgi:hypothetical protein
MEHFNRPKMTVLPESAVVPDANLVQPPPTQFTHEVTTEQPYYYSPPKHASVPDGSFSAGTKVVKLTDDDGPLCRVVDGRGLQAVTASVGLRPIE